MQTKTCIQIEMHSTNPTDSTPHCHTVLISFMDFFLFKRDPQSPDLTTHDHLELGHVLSTWNLDMLFMVSCEQNQWTKWYFQFPISKRFKQAARPMLSPSALTASFWSRRTLGSANIVVQRVNAAASFSPWNLPICNLQSDNKCGGATFNSTSWCWYPKPYTKRNILAHWQSNHNDSVWKKKTYINININISYNWHLTITVTLTTDNDSNSNL